MSARESVPLRLHPAIARTAANDTVDHAGSRLFASRAAVAVTVLAGFLAWGWMAGENGRALRALGKQDRLVLLTRTEANVRDLCLGRPDRPRAFCKGQAELLVSLDECQGSCLAAAREELRADSALK